MFLKSLLLLVSISLALSACGAPELAIDKVDDYIISQNSKLYYEGARKPVSGKIVKMVDDFYAICGARCAQKERPKLYVVENLRRGMQPAHGICYAVESIIKTGVKERVVYFDSRVEEEGFEFFSRRVIYHELVHCALGMERHATLSESQTRFIMQPEAYMYKPAASPERAREILDQDLRREIDRTKWEETITTSTPRVEVPSW